MDRRTETGRISFFAYLSLLLSHFARHGSVAVPAVFLQLPAFFFSCTGPDEAFPVATKTQIYIQWTKNPTPEALDLFFFDTLQPMRLDSYEQVTGLDRQLSAYAVSGSGDRQLAVISGTPGDLYAWTDIQTYGSLEKVRFSLEEEKPSQPKLVGETFLQAAQTRNLYLTLHPMLCAIRIRSVSADFSGHSYAGSDFRNNKLYLLNAGSECLPFRKDGGGPVSWMNLGRLDSTAVMALPFPELLLQEGYGSVGKSRILKEKEFFCYPNPSEEDNLASPITRLVLEGTVDGVRCYYPVNIPAMQPGCCYQFDITLTRMGSPDPDIPVESGAVILEGAIVPWRAYTPETLFF